MTQRLSHRIYAAFLLFLVVVAVLSAFAWRSLRDHGERERLVTGMAVVAGEYLPAADAPAAEVAAAVERLHRNLGVDVALYDAGRRPIAAAGESVPAPPPSDAHGGWRHRGRDGLALGLRLPDGRWLSVNHRRPQRSA